MPRNFRCWPAAVTVVPPAHVLQEPVWKPDAYEPEPEQKKNAAWVDAKSAEELEAGEDDAAFADNRFMAEYRCAGWRQSKQTMKKIYKSMIIQLRPGWLHLV